MFAVDVLFLAKERLASLFPEGTLNHTDDPQPIHAALHFEA